VVSQRQSVTLGDVVVASIAWTFVALFLLGVAAAMLSPLAIVVALLVAVL
jgi:hypothetical protein